MAARPCWFKSSPGHQGNLGLRAGKRRVEIGSPPDGWRAVTWQNPGEGREGATVGQKRNVSGPVMVLALFVVLVGAYFLFYRAELAPPGVDLLHGHEEEAPELPWSPPVNTEDLQALARGLAPLGLMPVFPPLSAERAAGVRIAVVAPGSPAEQAGLQPGDLVKRFGEWDTPQAFVLAAVLRRVDPKAKYEMVVVRGGEERTLVVTGLTPPAPVEPAI